jgi:hypothetical protein
VRKRPIAWAVALTLLTGVVLGPTAAFAQRAGGRSGGGAVIVGHATGSRPSAHRHGAHGSFASRSFFHRPFAPGIAIVGYGTSYGGLSYYGAPSYYYPSPVYAPPVMYGAPLGGTVSLAPSPPMPSVIEYPTGRYELRGDGVTAPYRWVWIPNPPSAPPTAPPPADAPRSPAPPASGPARPTTVYRWTDAEGVLHLTDRRDSIPARYR